MLATHDKLTVCCGAAVPVPANAAVTDGLVALLVNVTVAEDAPLAWGANVQVNGALCPAARVTGNDNPVSLNSGLLELADETVTLAPLAISDPDWF